VFCSVLEASSLSPPHEYQVRNSGSQFCLKFHLPRHNIDDILRPGHLTEQTRLW